MQAVDDTNQAMTYLAAGRLLHSILDEVSEEEDDASLPRIDGYILQRLLGEGGGGQVYYGVREGFDHGLAIKLLKKTSNDRATSKRAWRELDALGSLRLPSVPAVHDFGISNGRMFIVTEHVEGRALLDHCREHDLDLEARVALMARVADAVHSLHEHGVLHRDIKPDNIIIDPAGNPVVIDLGIATLLSADATETLTMDGVPIGTPAYMSPEQARGETSEVSTRSDVYSLGATACRVLAGRTPHDVNTALHEAIRRVAQEPPRSPREIDTGIPQDLSAIVSRAAARTPEDRYAAASEFAQDLRRWLNHQPIEWQRNTWRRRISLAWKRNPRRLLVRTGVTLVVALSTLAAVASFAWAQTADARRLLAETQLELQESQEQRLKEAEEFGAEKDRLANQWEQAAREREEVLQEYQNAKVKWKELIGRLRVRTEEAAENQMFFEAAFNRWLIAEQILDMHRDDQELIREFCDWMGKFFEQARAELEASQD